MLYEKITVIIIIINGIYVISDNVYLKVDQPQFNEISLLFQGRPYTRLSINKSIDYAGGYTCGCSKTSGEFKHSSPFQKNNNVYIQTFIALIHNNVVFLGVSVTINGTGLSDDELIEIYANPIECVCTNEHKTDNFIVYPNFMSPSSSFESGQVIQSIDGKVETIECFLETFRMKKNTTGNITITTPSNNETSFPIIFDNEVTNPRNLKRTVTFQRGLYECKLSLNEFTVTSFVTAVVVDSRKEVYFKFKHPNWKFRNTTVFGVTDVKYVVDINSSGIKACGCLIYRYDGKKENLMYIGTIGYRLQYNETYPASFALKNDFYKKYICQCRYSNKTITMEKYPNIKNSRNNATRFFNDNVKLWCNLSYFYMNNRIVKVTLNYVGTVLKKKVYHLQNNVSNDTFLSYIVSNGQISDSGIYACELNVLNITLISHFQLTFLNKSGAIYTEIHGLKWLTKKLRSFGEYFDYLYAQVDSVKPYFVCACLDFLKNITFSYKNNKAEEFSKIINTAIYYGFQVQLNMPYNKTIFYPSDKLDSQNVNAYKNVFKSLFCQCDSYRKEIDLEFYPAFYDEQKLLSRFQTDYSQYICRASSFFHVSLPNSLNLMIRLNQAVLLHNLVDMRTVGFNDILFELNATAYFADEGFLKCQMVFNNLVISIIKPVYIARDLYFEVTFNYQILVTHNYPHSSFTYQVLEIRHRFTGDDHYMLCLCKTGEPDVLPTFDRKIPATLRNPDDDPFNGYKYIFPDYKTTRDYKHIYTQIVCRCGSISKRIFYELLPTFAPVRPIVLLANASANISFRINKEYYLKKSIGVFSIKFNGNSIISQVVQFDGYLSNVTEIYFAIRRIHVADSGFYLCSLLINGLSTESVRFLDVITSENGVYLVVMLPDYYIDVIEFDNSSRLSYKKLKINMESRRFGYICACITDIAKLVHFDPFKNNSYYESQDFHIYLNFRSYSGYTIIFKPNASNDAKIYSGMVNCTCQYHLSKKEAFTKYPDLKTESVAIVAFYRQEYRVQCEINQKFFVSNLTVFLSITSPTNRTYASKYINMTNDIANSPLLLEYIIRNFTAAHEGYYICSLKYNKFEITRIIKVTGLDSNLATFVQVFQRTWYSKKSTFKNITYYTINANDSSKIGYICACRNGVTLSNFEPYSKTDSSYTKRDFRTSLYIGFRITYSKSLLESSDVYRNVVCKCQNIEKKSKFEKLPDFVEKSQLIRGNVYGDVKIRCTLSDFFVDLTTGNMSISTDHPLETKSLIMENRQSNFHHIETTIRHLDDRKFTVYTCLLRYGNYIASRLFFLRKNDSRELVFLNYSKITEYMVNDQIEGITYVRLKMDYKILEHEATSQDGQKLTNIWITCGCSEDIGVSPVGRLATTAYYRIRPFETFNQEVDYVGFTQTFTQKGIKDFTTFAIHVCKCNSYQQEVVMEKLPDFIRDVTIKYVSIGSAEFVACPISDFFVVPSFVGFIKVQFKNKIIRKIAVTFDKSHSNYSPSAYFIESVKAKDFGLYFCILQYRTYTLTSVNMLKKISEIPTPKVLRERQTSFPYVLLILPTLLVLIGLSITISIIVCKNKRMETNNLTVESSLENQDTSDEKKLNEIEKQDDYKNDKSEKSEPLVNERTIPERSIRNKSIRKSVTEHFKSSPIDNSQAMPNTI